MSKQIINIIVTACFIFLGGVVGYNLHGRFQPDPVIASNVEMPRLLNVPCGVAGHILVNLTDGSVKYRGVCEISEAAKNFWDETNRASPSHSLANIPCGKGYVEINPNGTVKFHGACQPDDAARGFWEAVSRVGPNSYTGTK